MPGLGEVVAAIAAVPLMLSCSSGGQKMLRRCLGLKPPVDSGPSLYRRLNEPAGPGGDGSAIAAKMLLNVKWWRGVLTLSAVSALAVGSVWDRTCNTDPNSVDACAPWRLGTIDMMYGNVAHARLASTAKSRFVPAAMQNLIRTEFCLPREVKQSFVAHRPRKVPDQPAKTVHIWDQPKGYRAAAHLSCGVRGGSSGGGP